MAKLSFDPQCYELAKDFLTESARELEVSITEADITEVAQTIQDALEMKVTDLCERKHGGPNAGAA